MTVENVITDPVPVKQAPRKGAGRRPDPNPFIADVRVIAGKLNPRTGQAMTVRETGALDERETLKQYSARTRRQLTAAGKIVAAEHGRDTPYRIGMNVAVDFDSWSESQQAYTTFVLTFWDREVRA